MAKQKDKDAAATPEEVKVHWDDAKMQTAYANVCNASCTREEVTLLFGTNQAWRPAQRDLTIQLSNRIVLSPFAAKRLALLLDATLKRYESSFGEIVIQTPKADS
jgi:Protein of unknown function (DUF3467)